jgi:hypothetical protein
MRAGLVSLSEFARAVEARYGRAVCSKLFPDYELKLLGYELFLDRSCDCCGAMLINDALGIEAYQLHQYKHACQSCFNALGTPELELRRRYARLVVFAAEQPKLLANVLVRSQRERDLSDDDIEDLLEVGRLGFLRLAMSPFPSKAMYGKDIARLAAYVGCSPVAVRTLIDDHYVEFEAFIL